MRVRRSVLLVVVVLVLHGAAAALAEGQAPDGGPLRRSGGQAPTEQAAAGGADLESRPGLTEADLLFNFVATRVSEAPRIDGVMDDLVWSEAIVLTEFVQSEPDEGSRITERTEVRVIYDDVAIYISAVCYDREPDRIVATVLRRDESNDDNDAFMVTLDTYHDHRNGYFFETNPMGARRDAQIIGEGGGGMARRPGFNRGFNTDWDAVWQSRARITDEGWMVEMAIPLWELRFEAGQSDWGINFRRTIRRKTEQAYWAPIPRQFDQTRVSLSGMVDELELAKPRNIQVKPFLIGGVNRGRTDLVAEPTSTALYENDYIGDLGGDAKWSVSTNLTLDLTVNTDFSQVEADDEQINLTRFSLFFPEKRDFFLENAGFFDFGGGDGGGRLGGGSQVVGFHSRTIGIGPNNKEIPLYGGGRLTGKVGAWSIGTLIMQSEQTSIGEAGETFPSNNYIVGRLSRDLGARSRLGVLFTNRQGSSTDYNREIGVDGRWGINAETTADAWIMKTETPGLEGDDWAGQVRFDWSSPLWQVRGSYLDVGENFNPEMGFVNRVGIRVVDPSVHWTPYFPDSRYVRNLSPHLTFRYTTDHEGTQLSRYTHADWDMFLKHGDKLSIAYNHRYELLEEPFEISDGVLIPPGVYEWGETNLELQSDAGRPVDGSFNYTRGGFWSGDRNEVRLAAGWRPGARLNLRLAWSHNDIDLPEGTFTTDLGSLRIGFDFTTDMSLGGLIQYNSQSDQFFANIRFRYIYLPGSDLYVVYNESRVAEHSDLIDRAVIVKVTRLFRF